MAESIGLAFIVLLVLFTAVSTLELSQCDNVKMRTYYAELGCIPNEDGPCPASYNCDNFFNELRAVPRVCRYQNRTILEGGRFESGDPCSGTCYCETDQMGKPTFSCEEYDCYFEEVPEGCYPRYDPNECCPNGTICPQNDPSIARCEYEGETYYEGMTFTAKNLECVSCTCRQGFDGTIDERWCEISQSNYNLHRSSEIFSGCIPVFQSSTCYAMVFRCPRSDDQVIPAPTNEGSDLLAKCRFGELELQVGDKLSDRNSDCTCITPPQVTCVTTERD